MKKNLFLVFLFSFSFFSHQESFGQTPGWVWARSAQLATSGTGPGSSEGYGVASDRSDNVYITGNYSNTITFGSYILTGKGACIAKYDSSGNVKWAKSSNTTAAGASGYGVCTDNFGNCYLSGYFTGTVSFGSYTLISAGANDLFLAKYDSSGNVSWAKNVGGVGDEYSYAAATDGWGNVYITGSFSSPSVTFGSFVLTNAGTNDIYLAKYDSSGNVLWAKSAGGTDDDRGLGIASDASGNTYISGYFGSATLSFGSYTLINAGTTDMFLAKYDSSGNVLWAKSNGGTSYDRGYGVATDSALNVYVAGYYDSPTISFGSTTLTNAGQDDAFLAKYDSSGNAIWAKGITGTGIEKGWSVAVDKNGKIYWTGSFNSASVTIDTFTLQKPAGSNDPMFIAVYNSSGNAIWAKELASGGDDINCVATGRSGSGAIYIGGDLFISTFIVGSDTLKEVGGEDIFVAKLFYSGLTPVFTSSDTVFCDESGKCINFTDHSIGNPTTWEWLFPGATPDTSSKQNPDSICYYTPGTYPVTLIVSNGSSTDTLAVSPLIIFAHPPQQPTITSVGDTLYSSHAVYYQWYFNGSPITGATDSFYICSQSGLYAVQITDINGCNSLSSGVSSCITGIPESAADGQWTVYPNPATNKLIIANTQPSTVNYELSIYNVLGEKVYGGLPIVNSQQPIVIDVRSFANGIYLAHVNTEDKQLIMKVIILH